MGTDGKAPNGRIPPPPEKSSKDSQTGSKNKGDASIQPEVDGPILKFRNWLIRMKSTAVQKLETAKMNGKVGPKSAKPSSGDKVTIMK